VTRGKRALGIGVVAALAAVLAAILLGRTEEAMLFPAPPAPVSEPVLADGARRAWIEAGQSRVEAFLLPARGEGSRASPLLLYAHGNGELVDFWLEAFEPLRARGISVLLVEYPGYGRSTGFPSEASVRDAFTAAYDWALGQPGVDPARIVGYGRSLGGGAVAALAEVRPLAALILESTFTSVGDVAHDAFGVPASWIRNAFDNLAVVRGYPAPVLVIHGEQDGSIPVAHARRLAEAAPDAELLILRCGHNDCARPWDRIARFLSARGLL
jgi:pimeloyl-ACP methyl ester carboxylesterase